MAKTIVKIDEKNVAMVEMVEQRQIFPRKQLVDEKTRLLERIATIDEMLAVFK